MRNCLLDLATDAEYVAKCQYVFINVQQCSLLHAHATGFHPDTLGLAEIAGIGANMLVVSGLCRVCTISCGLFTVMFTLLCIFYS